METFVSILQTFLTIYSFCIIGRALISWVDPTMQSAPARFLVLVTEPVIAPIRSVVPTIGMFDLSPIIALLLIQFIQRLLYRL